MEREIKFRAWDDGNMLQQPIDGCFGLSRFLGFLREDAILMQYTGLKDNNGKDIYDGDIIYQAFSDGQACRHLIIWEEEKSRFAAKWLPEIYYDTPSSLSQSWITENGKVIVGNRFSNPELLTSQSTTNE